MLLFPTYHQKATERTIPVAVHAQFLATRDSSSSYQSYQRPMPIQLIQVPYDSARRGQRMGAGPAHITAGWQGRAPALPVRPGREPHEPVVLETAAAWSSEISTVFELNRALAEVVRGAVLDGDLPIVLAGNCNTALGTIAGISAAEGQRWAESGCAQEIDVDPRIGVIWLDSHADFNTPDTTTSGFLDGMALATLTGHCWHTMVRTIPGFRTVSDGRVVLIGGTEIDAEEAQALVRAGLMHVPAGQVSALELPSTLDTVLDAFEARGVARVYLHIDLDVHDPAAARANEFPIEEGLAPEVVRDLVRRVAVRLPIAAAALTAYDPAYDPRNRMLRVALNLLDTLDSVAADRSRPASSPRL